MNNKFSKILGVSLTVAILASLLAVAIPVSAGTLEWGAEPGYSLSTAVTSNGLVSGSDVKSIVVEGSTVYAIASFATSGIIVKSTNGGASWSRLDAAIGAATTANLTTPTHIAAAPGDPNTLVVHGTNSVSAASILLLSTDGGVTFTPLSQSSSPLTTINDIKISPTAVGTRYITLAGNSAGAGDIQYLPIGSLVSTWTSVANAAVTSGDTAAWIANPGFAAGTADVKAIAFSPNFGGDRVLTAVTTTAGATNFELLSFASKKISATAGFVGYPVTALAAVSTNAAISLAPTYLGADDTLRVAFVALSTGAGGGKLSRLDNTNVRDFQTATDFSSVAFNGTDLVAGTAASNNVFYSANPLASIASVTVSNTSLFQRPGGTMNTQVAWAGANAVAGTSGPSSAFATSKDKGATFNDVSLVDTALTTFTDLAVQRDGNVLLYASHDGANTSIWRKAAAVERVLTLPGALSIFIRLDVSQNATNIYLLQAGSQNLWYSNDGGEKSWVARNSLLSNAVDLAVESASVVYALSGTGRVSKSVNAGFTFDAEVATGLSTGAQIISIRTNQLLVGGSDGTVAWSTDGNASTTTWIAKTGTAAPFTSGNVHLTADNLTNGFIYAASDAPARDVKRLQTPSGSFSDIITGTLAFPAKGIALSDGPLYVQTFDASTNSTLLSRNLKPATAGSTSPTGDWSTVSNAGHIHTAIPHALEVSVPNKFWEVNDGATTDAVHTFTDTTYKTPVTQSAPADAAVLTTNPVTGRAQDVAFTWARLGVTTTTTLNPAGNGYQLEIALDSAFNQIIFTANPTLGNLPATTSDPVVIIVGPDQPTARNYPFAPGTTYYWRVKAVSPLESPVSVTRSFKYASLAPAFAIKGPAVGETNVPIKPILSWTDYEGALWYELTVSEDPTFAIPEFSHNVGAGIKPPTTFYGVTETLKYDTTYYWRVRGVTAEPFVKGTTVVTPAGPWQTGAFTTMADPAKAPGAPTTPGTPAQQPDIIVQPAPVTVNPTPVQTQVVEVIPQWMLVTVIIIGAVLVIALIVLIVRTRKAA